jgi:hypothetical protein
MVPMRVTVKSFAELLHTPLYGQYRILHEQKYPRKAPACFMIPYYQLTRRGIHRYFERGNDASHFPVNAGAIKSNKPDVRENNFRSIQSFLNSSHANRVFTTQAPRTFDVAVESALLRFTPDVIGRDAKGDVKYLIFDFTEAAPDKEVMETVIELAHHTVTENGLTLKPRDIEYIHLETKQQIIRTSVRSRTLQRAKATAKGIAALWPNL